MTRPNVLFPPVSRLLKTVGADMVLVCNGGLGSAFDELELNRVLCLHHNVRLAGVILNKVRLDKYEQTKDYMSRALMQQWGVPLLGCIPDRPFLGAYCLLFSILSPKLLV